LHYGIAEPIRYTELGNADDDGEYDADGDFKTNGETKVDLDPEELFSGPTSQWTRTVSHHDERDT
jgi:hypothetical protein